ncbi:MAG: PAS domain-containing protein [Alphaproteobacteria bacterium]|nr:PAS domain-containing protein [Alphaproteobacteria bacterium]
MGEVATRDAAEALNAIAKALRWPLKSDREFQFREPALRELCDLWRAKARQGIPRRHDFDLRALKSVISNTMIIERITGRGGAIYRFRLVGLRITEILGDMNGRVMHEFLPANLVPRWSACIDAVLDNEQPLRIQGNFEIPSADYLAGEIFLAPMRDARDATSFVLGAMYFHTRDEPGSPGI